MPVHTKTVIVFTRPHKNARERFHRFRVDRRPKRIKKYAFTSVCVFNRFRVDGALSPISPCATSLYGIRVCRCILLPQTIIFRLPSNVQYTLQLYKDPNSLILFTIKN